LLHMLAKLSNAWLCSNTPTLPATAVAGIANNNLLLYSGTAVPACSVPLCDVVAEANHRCVVMVYTLVI